MFLLFQGFVQLGVKKYQPRGILRKVHRVATATSTLQISKSTSLLCQVWSVLCPRSFREDWGGGAKGTTKHICCDIQIRARSLVHFSGLVLNTTSKALIKSIIVFFSFSRDYRA